jgi:hypothetical protein
MSNSPASTRTGCPNRVRLARSAGSAERRAGWPGAHGALRLGGHGLQARGVWQWLSLHCRSGVVGCSRSRSRPIARTASTSLAGRTAQNTVHADRLRAVTRLDQCLVLLGVGLDARRLLHRCHEAEADRQQREASRLDPASRCRCVTRRRDSSSRSAEPRRPFPLRGNVDEADQLSAPAAVLLWRSAVGVDQ